MDLQIIVSIIIILIIDTQIPGLKSSLIDCFNGGMHAKNVVNENTKNKIDPTI